MPGLRKSAIADKVIAALCNAGCTITPVGFVGPDGDLPWECSVTFDDNSVREFRLYFWTISHGGRTRSTSEYRIQAKLKRARVLEFAKGTTLLLGYYSNTRFKDQAYDGLERPSNMELFAAWDPLQHLRLGASSSCQVNYDLLLRAHLSGVATGQRRTGDGYENVIVVRPERLAAYFRAAAGGHNSLDMTLLG